MLALLLSASGRSKEAIIALDAALRDHPDAWTSLEARARLELAGGDPEKALGTAREMLTLWRGAKESWLKSSRAGSAGAVGDDEEDGIGAPSVVYAHSTQMSDKVLYYFISENCCNNNLLSTRIQVLFRLQQLESHLWLLLKLSVQ